MLLSLVNRHNSVCLQVYLQTILIRRVKEEVEPDLPPMEEVIIRVEMTPVQRVFYKALYGKNLRALLLGNGSSLPALRNLCMQLRKLLCHPVG